ncbi:MAG: sodium:calcium antiporter [Halolamina sp.]
MDRLLRHPLAALAGAMLLAVPWLVAMATGATHGMGELTTVVVSGLAVVGASFVLAWGAETAEKDVPRAFALAVLAVLAVAPEYAVDALYAWQAGMDPGSSEAANLAVANMTGANRILIGIGWSVIALFSIYKAYQGHSVATTDRDGPLADAVQLDPSISTEIAFLLVATAFAFLVPVGIDVGFGVAAPNLGIDLVDTLVLVGLYVAYIVIVLKAEDDHEEEQVGVPAYLQAYPKVKRVPVVLGLFAFSGLLIFTAVEPFAHGLEVLGKDIGIPSFFMIQWIAPLASESPELIVTAYLVNKARSTAAFNALISSKLNQWTLLIGTLVVVYSVALGQYGALPFDRKQAAEIWLTAAQSLFALAVLVDFNISIRESLALLVLFVSQVVIEFGFIQSGAPASYSYWLLIGYTVLYIVLGVALFARRWDALVRIVRRTKVHAFQGRLPEYEDRTDVASTDD